MTDVMQEEKPLVGKKPKFRNLLRDWVKLETKRSKPFYLNSFSRNLNSSKNDKRVIMVLDITGRELDPAVIKTQISSLTHRKVTIDHVFKSVPTKTQARYAGISLCRLALRIKVERHQEDTM
jgi:hypothetical protein